MDSVKPAILTVDDDPGVSAAISRDLRGRYGRDYRIVRATSGAEALDLLDRMNLRNQPVALIAADQRMPQMTGIELLARARDHAATAKYLLLTAYADTEVAIQAINDIGLDYYLLKPWDPPEERLYPVIDELLADWRAENPESTVAVRIVGHRWSERAHELRQFLTRNHVPYKWLDVEADPEGERLRSAADVDPGDLPLVLVPDSDPLISPHPLELARALGLRTTAEQQLYDVCIVGAGPAGLAAAVYAASEGLSTVIVEREAPGGQAGQSAAIENYLGFPRGLSGADLTHRALAQVTRFGAELVLAREVTALEARGPARVVLYEEAGETAAIEARAVIVATGVSYRRLAADGVDALTGRGVYYGADATEAAQCAGDDVYLIGAANSAGQAALNLAKHARRVVLLVRGPAIEATMSQYLVDRIQAAPTVEVRTSSEVAAVAGTGHLECLTIKDRGTGATEVVQASWLFVFIGAEPRTDWLGETVARDSHGFVVTGPDVGTAAWPLERAPYSLETSVPGVFAAGDVRLDSMKRVASAVGEGAMTVYHVHRYLGDDLMRLEDLRPIPLFDGLDDSQLGELLAAGEEIAIEDGVVLFREGDHADFWWVLVDGAIELVRHVGREDVVVGRMANAGLWAGGFRAWDEQGVYLATSRGVERGRMFRLPSASLRALLDAWFPFGVHIVNGIFGTARRIEATARQRDSLVTLGRLAAGLAHELNNPAAAAVRAVAGLEANSASLLASLGDLAQQRITAEQFANLDLLRRELGDCPRSFDALALADAEDRLDTWLERRGVEQGWEIAPALAAAAADVDWCERADALLGPALPAGLGWVAATISLSSTLGEIRESTRRVSELVSAVRSYSQMDRGSRQPTQVTEGIDSTLVMLGHKVPDGVEVVRAYAADLPSVDAFPGELNQVWTNLVDNALDAMGDSGVLRVATRRDGDHVVVEVCDTGPGLSPDVAARAFEAFFTTKDVGQGTGLGLDIARRIVVERHGGEIVIHPEAGNTVFEVRIPITHSE